MGIQIHSGYLGTLSYQNYRRPEIKEVHPEELQQPVVSQNPQNNAPSPDEIERVDTRTRKADLQNISLTFQKEDSFDYLGSESTLENLDMQKAVSDMRKDSILQEYQYFVGSSQALFQPTEDGIVIPKF